LYRRARLLYRDRKVTEADPLMRHAAAEFRSAHSPMADVCDYYQSSILFDEHKSIEALSLIQNTLTEVSPSFIALRAQMEWNVGTIAANRGQLDEALRAYTASLRLFERLGESENAAAMRAALASTLAHFGRTQEAWTMRYQVFDAASRAGGEATLPFVIQAAIGDEALEHHWNVVRSLAALQLAARGMNPRMRFAALLRHAWADYELGDASSFETYIRRANIVAASLSDPALRATSADDADFVTAVEAVQRDPRGAIARLNRCEEFAVANERSGNLPAIYLARGRAYRAGGDTAHAIQDVEQSVSVVERRRDAIRRDDLRDTYFSAGYAAYHELTDLLLKQGNAAAAFETNERSRARLILDRLSTDARRVAMTSALELTSHLRNEVNLIEFVSLPDRLAIFTISSSGFRSVETSLSRTALLEHIRALTAAIATGNERGAAAQLYSDLIAPANLPNDNLPIVIVPDDATNGIPYPVLWDTLRSQYLIERQPIIVAPNATSFIEIRRHLPTRRRPARLFAVGDPTFDAALFPGLVRLPAAAEEVFAIAKLYDESACLTATDATAARLTAGLRRANVIHIAAHSVRNATDALLSGFVLATSARASALLTVRDIASLSLPLRPVVVLAGCQTGRKADGASDLQSLAAAFVVSGSSSVIGSLWDIDDADAAEVSREFHQQLRQGFSASVALQATQLAMLRSNDPALSRPRTWAAFETYGSGN
jgi:CHAT domain-containing protein